MTQALRQRKIIVGVSGGIAAYKAAELVRLLAREGAGVRVAMSANAARFVAPLTFQALSGNPVYHDVFQQDAGGAMPHIDAAQDADAMIIAPASANAIARIAHGFADDALSTLFLAYAGPVIIAPAMNDKMYAHPATRANLETLRARGARIIEPECGELACGVVGHGRLPEPAQLLAALRGMFAAAGDFQGRRVLITAGPTREPLDPVRYITNASSGKMGYALAERARDRGASVTLISGPTHLPAPSGVELAVCARVEEMRQEILTRLPEHDVVIMAAAVGDFVAEETRAQKIKKEGQETLTLVLRRAPDLLEEIGRVKNGQIVVGFAAETENLAANALGKLRAKKLDLIVANDVSGAETGFQSDFNRVTLIDGEGHIRETPRLPKREIADQVLDAILALPRARRKTP